jgi:predicted ATPase/DNA-binding XRE family transcriptional regulator
MPEEQAFGTWLRLRRKALDLTRESLADRVGYSAATIRKIEAGERRPSAQVAEQFAAVLNIPPAERAAFIKYARGDLQSAAWQSIEEAPLRGAPSSHRSNLPFPATSLIGREQEVADVREYILRADIRLVTLKGPPGIGKTRLGLESAHTISDEFFDGVFFVPLAPLDDPSLLARTIIQSLGYVETMDGGALEQLINGIGNKQMLLVLDNLEHLMDGAAPLVSALLSACPRLKILVTSREASRVSGEWVYSVPALTTPKEISSTNMEAVPKFPGLILFAERAHAVRTDFALTAANIKIVASICARLDGLPLAIELIAARIRLMSPQVLLEHLSDQFVLSADGMRTESARQRTLHHAIGWSYALLPPEERRLFAYLSIFAGGFTLDAVESMFSHHFKDKPVGELLASLFDKSLIQRTSNELRGDGYDMLATIRQFASNCLRRIGHESSARNLHLAYFLDLAAQADKDLRGPNQVAWLKRLNTMRDNLRAALEWAIESGQAEAALQMARKLHWFWFVRSDHNEGRQWLGRILTVPDASLYPESYAEALTQLAHHTWVQSHRAWLQGGANEALPPVVQALAVARNNNDRHNIARALAMRALVFIDQKDFASAQSTLDESKVLFQEVHDQWGHAHAVLCEGFAEYLQDNQSTSLALNEQALAEFREVGDRYFMSVTLRYIGELQTKQGNLTQGEAALREALILSHQLEAKFEIAMSLWSAAEAAQNAKKPAHAVALYWMAKNVYDSIGSWIAEDETDFENRLRACSAQLDESVFATAIEQGRAMNPEQAIQYALEEMK